VYVLAQQVTGGDMQTGGVDDEIRTEIEYVYSVSMELWNSRTILIAQPVDFGYAVLMESTHHQVQTQMQLSFVTVSTVRMGSWVGTILRLFGYTGIYRRVDKSGSESGYNCYVRSRRNGFTVVAGNTKCCHPLKVNGIPHDN
jgi:hypothetical protein